MLNAMLRKLRKAPEGERGFTLIELVVVLAILGLLIALALPSFLGARTTAARDEMRNFGQEWRSLMWACFLGNPINFSTTCNTDGLIGFSDSATHWALASNTAPGNSGAYNFDPSTAGTGTKNIAVIRCFPGNSGDVLVGAQNNYQLELVLSGTGQGTLNSAFVSGAGADKFSSTGTCPTASF